MYFLILLFHSGYVSGQRDFPVENTEILAPLSCPSGSGLIFTKQQAVDNFIIDWPDCRELPGSLIIGQISSQSDITHLDGLSGLTSVGGNLTIEFNPQLTDLEGLNQLHTVAGAIYMAGNNALVSSSGLRNLTSVGSSVTVAAHSSLRDLNAFKNITILNGNLAIQGNSALENLRGLENIVSAPGISIVENDNLGSLQGLNSLEEAGNIVIQSNPALKNMSGLDNLRHVDRMRIIDNSGLMTLEGIERLSSIGGIEDEIWTGNFEISGNPSLNSLTSFSQLREIEGSLKIQKNLTLLSLKGLDSLRYIAGHLEIVGNDSLEDLVALRKLRKVWFNDQFSSRLELKDNLSLKSISGLSALDSAQVWVLENNPLVMDMKGPDSLKNISSLIIRQMKSLKNLDGLTSKVKIEALHILDNDSLISLSGLEGQIELTELYIEDNDLLPNLEGLNNLSYVSSQGLHISRNASLASLTALQSLTRLWWGFTITGNDILSSLSGLDNLNPQMLFDITITDNPQLSMCAVESICQYLDLLRTARISNNAPDCNSRQEVTDVCEGRCDMTVDIISDQDTLCAGEEVILSAIVTDPAGDVSYLWNTGDTSSTIQITENMSQMYMLTVTDVENCAATASKWVEVISEPEFEIITSPTTCGENNGIAVLWHDGSVYDYLWDDGQTEVIAENLPPGDIGVLITDSYNCVYAETAYIEGSEPLEVVIVGDLAICDGEVGHLSVTDTYETYMWSDGSIGRDVQYTAGGMYSVTVTSDVCVAEDSVQVIVHSRPDVSILVGDTTLTVIIAMGTSSYNIEWNTGENTETIVPSMSGTYSVTVTDFHGCTAEAEQDFILSHTSEEDATKVVLYPNPGRELILCRFNNLPGLKHISISDINGREVFRTVIEDDKVEVDISTWIPGLYMLRLQNAGTQEAVFIKN